jgi:hypothetical protein
MASAAPSLAHAQDAAACRDGYDRSQVSRDDGKLVEARRLLQQCSAVSCSAFVQKECVGWLSDVEARLPSVILSAKDDAGADLVDVAVSIDGHEGPRKLDGRAIDIDPGEHTFVFQLADGRKAEQRAFLREREKGKSVAVTMGAPRAAAASPGKPSDAPVGGNEPRASGGRSPLIPVGFIAAGVGVAGLAVGTIFGLEASSKLSAPHCDTAAKVCDPGVIGDAKSAATVSTIGFIAGGVLVAGGVTLVLLAPRGGESAPTETKSARLSAAPMIGLNGGGLSVRGAW